ncbi:hypothetical protein TDB9533_00742 [Thalassocella blandensis]|nr:hypothetical protein TDB9533_00742 [Thalassocella blandensis]
MFNTVRTIIITFTAVSASLLGACWSYETMAHGRWIVPSHTILSAEEAEFVTFDLSISNELFYPDWAIGGVPIENIGSQEKIERELPPPLRPVLASSKLVVHKPDGTTQSDYTLVDLRRKTVTMAELVQNGSYHIEYTQNPIYLTWYSHADGSPGRFFGTLSQVQKLLPEGAKDIRQTILINRIETWITRNNLTRKNLKPQGKGLELAFDTHPNELFVGEKMKFTVMFDGKPLKKPLSLHFIQNGTRYRDDRNVIDVSTNNGKAVVTWQKPGLYLLETEYEKPSTEKGIESETHALYATFEVFPE